MFDKENNPIREEWEEYYEFLEALRKSGVCNMFGSGPYMKEEFTYLSKDEITKIFCSWAANYDELNKKYGWRS